MVPYLLLQCLLLSFISGHVTAQFFGSLFRGLSSGFSRALPEVIEMKPLAIDSSVLDRDMKFNFDSDVYKPLLDTKNIESDLSALWDKRQKGGVMETNLGGSENNGNVLPHKNDKGLDPSRPNEEGVNEETPEKGGKDHTHIHIHIPEKSDEEESNKKKNHKNEDPAFFWPLIRKADIETYTAHNPLHEWTFYGIIVTIGVSVIVILYISFKKCRKPKRSDDLEPIML